MNDKKKFLLELADVMDKYGIENTAPLSSAILFQSQDHDWIIYDGDTTNDIRKKVESLKGLEVTV